MLALFDLDGFKHYNDSFGHPSGDALLQRLGESLGRRRRGPRPRVPDGRRRVLRPARTARTTSRVAACSAALNESGEGFTIGCSHGAVLLPDEAHEASDALRIADQRLYEHKRGGRRDDAARDQGGDAPDPRRARPRARATTSPTSPRSPRASPRRSASTPARSSTCASPPSCTTSARSRSPTRSCCKPGPLDAGEWRFMERHTLIGERIIGSSPGARAGRRDGPLQPRALGRRAATPTGSRGEDIPLGARIVAVCDAFDAMTKDRSYRAGMDPEAALAELQRCAGSQFDPAVVAAFETAVRSHAVAVRPRRLTRRSTAHRGRPPVHRRQVRPRGAPMAPERCRPPTRSSRPGSAGPRGSARGCSTWSGAWRPVRHLCFARDRGRARRERPVVRLVDARAARARRDRLRRPRARHRGRRAARVPPRAAPGCSRRR